MATVLIVAYLLIVLAMIVVILLQRSEGGGLGMGSGGGGGGFMSARGSANLLTRTTAILGALFMVTAIGLTIVSQLDRSSSSILDQAAQNEDGSPATVLDALDAMGTGEEDLAVPEAPAEPQGDLTVPDSGEAEPAQNGDLAVPESSMMSTISEEEPAPAEASESEAAGN